MNVCVNFILFVADGLRQINGDTGRHLYGFTASILSLFVSIAGLAICYFTGAFGIRRVGENLVEKTEEELQRSVKTVSSEEIHETLEKDIGSLEKIEEKQEIKQTVAMSDDDKEDSSRDAIDVFDDKAQEMSYVEDLSARTENERDKNVKHEEKKFLTMEQRRQEFFEGMSAEEREKYNSALTSVIAPDFDTEDSKVDLYLQNLPTDKLTIDSFD
jgi:hypothetical protein